MFKDLNPYVKLGIFAVGGYLVYRFGSKALVKLKVSPAEKEEWENKTKGMKESYSEYEYNQFAKTLQEAKGTFDDDEDIVYGIFRKLKNDLDFLALDKAFGSYDPGWFSDSQTMVAYLNSFLNTSERKKVNDILIQRKIKYRI